MILLPYGNKKLFLHLAAISNFNVFGRVPRSGPEGLHLLEDVHALDHPAEDHVLAVQPVALGGGDEELRPVGVGASVGHGEEAGRVVRQSEVLVPGDRRLVSGRQGLLYHRTCKRDFLCSWPSLNSYLK